MLTRVGTRAVEVEDLLRLGHGVVPPVQVHRFLSIMQCNPLSGRSVNRQPGQQPTGEGGARTWVGSGTLRAAQAPHLCVSKGHSACREATAQHDNWKECRQAEQARHDSEGSSAPDVLVGRGGGTVASVSEVLYLGTYAVSAGGQNRTCVNHCSSDVTAPSFGCTQLAQWAAPRAQQNPKSLERGAPRQ